MKFTRFTNKHIIALFLLLWPMYSYAENTGAVTVIEEFHAVLIDVMQNAEKLGFQGRYDKLAPVIKSRFDTPLIARVILSRYWNELNEAQQEQFINVFNRLSISTYASRFNSYANESFKMAGVEELKKGRLLIKTEFLKPNDKPVKFDYMVHQKEGSWYIISVIANGINDVALKRAEYPAIINEKGFNSLVSELETKIKELGGPADNL